MLAKLAILGGSSPFTVALIDELARPEQQVPACELTLQGRNSAARELICEYACHRLQPSGWHVRHCLHADEALAGADIVLHQVRYGGMAGRAADEQLALELGLPVDETLGPGGLQSALRSADELRGLASLVERVAPRAWLLNLTNPLSVATRLLSERIGPKCIGLCELPWHTACEACALAGVHPSVVDWNYAGLNHRGFIYRLCVRGVDLIERLISETPDAAIDGIAMQTIRLLGAVPLKYFRLMSGNEVLTPGRAAALEELRNNLLAELRADVTRRPPSITLRDMSWYALSVVPVMRSILCNDGRQHIVNLVEGSVARELPARITSAGPIPVKQSAPSAAVQSWIDRFVEHEQAVLAAVSNPDLCRIQQAVELDPLVPPARAATVARRVFECFPGNVR